MQVSAITAFKTNNNKNNYTPQFEAKFMKSDIERLIKDASKDQGAAGMPKLYALLSYMKREIPGTIAKITKEPKAPKRNIISIDGKQVYSLELSNNNTYKTLKDFLVGSKSHKDYISMPEIIFEQNWWMHRHTSEREIQDIFTYKKPEAFKKQAKGQTFYAKRQPYYVIKEEYATKAQFNGEVIRLSNIDILGLEKTENGRAQLDSIAERLNTKSKQLFDFRRKVAKEEIEVQKNKPGIFKLPE